ncbi:MULTISPECIES: TetR/AcrR family transcriptional regulator [unclassified Rhodococcus (in: high G+C Gram-positive bacteria)]|uniref:TetR/AcrR family transcriptional regulator n=1 Tax=unclassified Rhodococcus (in: high G+C Gram-positive bacteria) TaxID=192944 RepID=UPI00163A9B24|nr:MULTISPECIES: TetR/AcrR family transcriptional regulator [unclassified Rhodococcus (in: high G+C Gram-positive bacteria)]MBC2640541.1 TetR/AcrR family transcriptional regulator [Rhodococcus sp. 3A]MBC2894713.1 TetR/AcrR family transcriptional regulator [Rhodococcus sp. 4CII]
MPTGQRKDPSQRRSQATVARILSATGQVLRTKGYTGCSTNAIAEAAGISKGSVYQYFANKDEIIEVLIDQLMEDATASLGANLEEAVAQGTFLKDAALQIQLLAVLDRYRDVLASLLNDAPHLTLSAHRSVRIEERCRDLLRTYVTVNPSAIGPGVDLDALLLVLTVSYREVSLEYLRQDLRNRRNELATVLYDMTMGGLAGGATKRV